MAIRQIKDLAASQGIGQDPPAATDALLKEKADGQPSWCTIAQLIPAGGAAGQALTKVDGLDYNFEWATPTGGGTGDGDMLVATYDPQAIEADVFDRANHTGTQLLSTISDAGALASFDTVATAQIDDDAVTLAKQAHGTANRLIGYNASGVPVEITAGSGISITGAEIAATGGGGEGAPLGASYLVLSNDVDLTNERALAVSGGLQGTDGGANGSYTISGGQLQTLQREADISAGGTYQITASDLGKILPFSVATTVTIATGITIADGDFHCVIEKTTAASGDVTFDPTGITHHPQGGTLASYVIDEPGGQVRIYQKGGGDVYGTVGRWELPVKALPVSADHVLGEDSENGDSPVLIPVSELASADIAGLAQVTDADLSGPYTVPNNRKFLVIQANENLAADRTTALPADPLFPGQQILLQRWGGGFFEWRVTGFGTGGDAVLYRGDAVLAVANDAANAWARKIPFPPEVEKTFSEGLGGTVVVEQAKYTNARVRVTAATTYQLEGDLGSGVYIRFVQNGGQVTIAAANGATLYSGAPTQTVSHGDELQVAVTNNPDGNTANIQVKLVLANPSTGTGEGGSIQRRTPFASGGAYEITSADLGEVLPFTDATTVTIATGISVPNGDFWCVIEKAGTGNISFDPTGITHEPRGSALPSYTITTTRGQVMIVQKGGGDVYLTSGDWSMAIMAGNLAATGTATGTLAGQDSGKVLRTTGNITIPQTAGFNVTLVAGGSHTVTYNATTSAPMAAGDLMSIVVDDQPVIHAVLTAAAEKVAFS